MSGEGERETQRDSNGEGGEEGEAAQVAPAPNEGDGEQGVTHGKGDCIGDVLTAEIHCFSFLTTGGDEGKGDEKGNLNDDVKGKGHLFSFQMKVSEMMNATMMVIPRMSTKVKVSLLS